jgi:hypothetical protein
MYYNFSLIFWGFFSCHKDGEVGMVGWNNSCTKQRWLEFLCVGVRGEKKGWGRDGPLVCATRT